MCLTFEFTIKSSNTFIASLTLYLLLKAERSYFFAFPYTVGLAQMVILLLLLRIVGHGFLHGSLMTAALIGVMVILLVARLRQEAHIPYMVMLFPGC